MMRDCVLELMIREGVPLTRANYLQIAYLGNPPEDAEVEIEPDTLEVLDAAEEAADAEWLSSLGVRV